MLVQLTHFLYLKFPSQLKGMSGEAAQEEVKVMVEKLKLGDKKDALVSKISVLHVCAASCWQQLRNRL